MRALAGALLLLLPLTGCGADDEDGTTLTVLAAASLTEVFGELAEQFEAEHEGVRVVLSLGSSTDLAETAADGAPGDVLATADETSMQLALDAGAALGPPRPFATNELVVVTAPGNPLDVGSLADLAGTTWVRCADDVPCGRVAADLLAGAEVTAEPASLEPDVKATLEKVVSGEADAALVYASDAQAAGAAVETVPVAGAEAALTTYYLAPLQQAGDDALAADWVDLVTSAPGQQALGAAGFGLP